MPITSFRGQHFFLSNFSACTVTLDGLSFPSVEHAYQAAKTLDVRDREAIRKMTAGEAKKMGRRLTIRPEWEQMKVEVMRLLLRQKFASAPFKAQLLATGAEVLIEGNTWGDQFWGCTQTFGGWKGRNIHGVLLMEIREELRLDAPHNPNNFLSWLNKQPSNGKPPEKLSLAELLTFLERGGDAKGSMGRFVCKKSRELSVVKSGMTQSGPIEMVVSKDPSFSDLYKLLDEVNDDLDQLTLIHFSLSTTY